MNRSFSITILAFLCGEAYCPAADPPQEFEVASVKLSGPRTGPEQGTMGCFRRDPSRYVCLNASVSLMAMQAYGLKPYQLRPPFSEDTVRFNVEARVPPGATTEQVKVMLQHLLAERFQLSFHRENVEVQGYALMVAKGGPKLRETVPESRASGDSAPPRAPQEVENADGFHNFRIRNGFSVSRANGLTRWVGTAVSTNSTEGANLCGMLNSITGQPVIDATGLTGKYDLVLTFSSDSAAAERQLPARPGDVPPDSPGMTIFAALEKQLGLKLERRKVPVEAFVIDHAEKTPVEN